jgi:hypothetical protein
MNIFRIKTTAWEEEDLVLLTTLSEEQIKEIVSPIVKKDRDVGEEYDNKLLVKALKGAYPDESIRWFNLEIQTITI